MNIQISSPHHHNAQSWIHSVCGRNSDRFTKRDELRRYVRQNLSAGQVYFSHAETARWAAAQCAFVSSAYASTRDAFKASFSVYRGAFTLSTNSKHQANS